MAIIATLIGGIFGFASFLTARLAFDASFGNALWVYAITGFIITALVIGAAFLPTRADTSEPETA